MKTKKEVEKERPTLCKGCQDLVKDSPLEWVLCGGQTVGMEEPTYSWQLRPRGEVATEANKARTLQRLASAARLLCILKEVIGDEDLKEKIDLWLKRK